VGGAIIGHALTDDHARIIDRLSHREDAEVSQSADGIEVGHFALREKKRMHRSILDRGEPYDEPGRVDSNRAALIAPERAEIGRQLVRAQEGMIGRGLSDIRGAYDVRGTVCVGRAAGAAERAEVYHFAILVKKGVERTIRGQ